MNYDKKLVLSMLLDFYGDMLSERRKEIAQMSYNEDLSLREISENTGITPQGVRDSLKKTEEILLNFEEKLGLNATFNEMKETIGDIITRLDLLKEKCPSALQDIEDITERAKGMLK